MNLKSGAQLSKDYGQGDNVAADMQRKLLTVQRIAPWAIYGYNSELVNAWNKNRAAFMDAVQKRAQTI